MKEIYRGKSIVVLRNKDEVRIKTGETEDKMHRTTLSRMFKRLGGFEGIDLHYSLKAGEGEKRGNGAFQYKYSLPRNPEERKEFVESFLENLGVTPLEDLGKKKVKDESLFRCRCGNTFRRRLHNMFSYRSFFCGSCQYSKVRAQGKNRGTELEKEVISFLDKIGVKYETQKRIGRYVADIYVPEKRLVIEVDGLFPHREERWRNQEKALFFIEQGVDHLIFNEYELREKRKIVESILINRLGKTEVKVWARETKVVELDYKEAKEFLEENHLHGVGEPASAYLGLEWKGSLVFVMGMKRRKEGWWELYRMASARNTLVVGGASKVFSRFLDTGIRMVYSYSYLSLGKGEVYRRLGFSLEKVTQPGYFWFKKSGGKIKIVQRQNASPKRLGLEGKTEVEEMRERGFTRYFDAGNLRWVYVHEG